MKLERKEKLNGRCHKDSCRLTLEQYRQIISGEAEELFWELKKGFDSYNLKQIENVLALLEELELSEAQKELLPLLQEACDELEYEKGSELLRDIE